MFGQGNIGQSLSTTSSGRQFFNHQSLFGAGMYDSGFLGGDGSQYFDNNYQSRSVGSQQHLVDGSDVDFANFPWLPDFDYHCHNQFQSTYINSDGNFNGNSSSFTTTGSSDSSSEISGGELETFPSKCLKRKNFMAQIVDDISPEGDVDRRERNRLNAKKARLRKKQLLGSLQGQLAVLRGENSKLRRVIAARIPEKSIIILNKSGRLAELLTAAATAP